MSVAGGQQTTQEIEAKHGKGRVFFHQLDVSNEAEGMAKAFLPLNGTTS